MTTLNLLKDYKIEDKVKDGKYKTLIGYKDSTKTVIKIFPTIPENYINIFLFKKEIKRVNDLGLVQIIDIIEKDKEIILTYKYIEGVPLSNLKGKLSLDEILKIMIKTFSVIKTAHDNNIYLFNLKPENIIYNKENDTVYILDFGIHFLKKEISLYTAPEFITTNDLNSSSDIYSLGLIFYELISKKEISNTQFPSYNKIFKKIPLNILKNEIPEKLNTIFVRLLEIDPVYRPDAGYVIEFLESYLKGKEIRSEFGVSSNIQDILKYPPFIGREEETFFLYKEIHRIVTNKVGNVIFIKGKEGIGKTRLISESFKICNMHFNILEVKPETSSKTIPYYLIKKLIFEILVLLENENQESNMMKSKISLYADGLDIKEIWSLIKDVADIDFIMSYKDYSLTLDKSIEKERFVIICHKLFEILIERFSPLVIVIDNLEYTDELSLEILSSLHELLSSKVLTIFVLNTDYETDKTRLFLNNYLKNGGKSIELVELSFNEIQNFIQKFLNNYSKESIFFASFIYNLSKGNPFFTIQLIKYFSECLSYNKEKGAYEIDKSRLEKVKLPEFFYQIISNLFESLSNKTKEFLKSFALLGDGFDIDSIIKITNSMHCLGRAVDLFDIDSIIKITGFSIEDFETIFKELLDSSIIKKEDLLGKDYYYFTHSFIREVIISLTGKDKESIRKNLLNNLIEFYEKEKNKEKIVISISSLAKNEKDKEPFLKYFYETAKIYRENGWYTEALNYFILISKHFEENNKKDELYFDVIYYISHIANIIGDISLAQEYSQKLLYSDNRLNKIKGLYLLGESNFKKGEFINSASYFNRVIDLVKENKTIKKVLSSGLKDFNITLIISSLYYLVWIYSFINYKKTKKYIYLLKRYTELLSPKEFYHYFGYRTLAAFYLSLGKIKKSKKIVNKSMNIARKYKNEYAIAVFNQSLGYIHQIKGDYDESIFFIKNSLEYFDKIKDIREIGVSLLILGFNYYYKGDYKNASKAYVKFSSLFNEIGDYYGILSSFIIQAKILREKGDYFNCENILKISKKLSDEKGIDYVKAFIYLEYAKLKSEGGEIDEAKEMILKAYSLFKYSGSFASYFIAYYPINLEIMINTYLHNKFSSDKEEKKLKRSVLREVNRSIRATRKWVNYKYLVFREAARFYEVLGKNGKALKYYKKAIKGLERLGRLYDLGLCLYYFGVFLKNNYKEIDYSIPLKKAFSIFNSIDNKEYTKRISSLISTNEYKDTIKEIDSLKLKMIINFNTEIASILYISILLNLILDYSIKITNAERGILLLKDEKGSIEPVAYKYIERLDTRFSKKIVKNVIDSGNYFITTNIDKAIEDELSSYNIRSIMCVPIKKENHVIGAIYLDNSLISGIFTEEDVNLLSIFTNQAYVSIENAKLHTKVIRDDLTGTFSKTYFDFLIDKEIARCERYQSTFSLLAVDIDNFSFLIDMHGPKKGDELIKRVSYTINECIRTTDYISRFYEDKFFILLPETDLIGSEILAKRILNKFRDSLFDNIKITVSIGIVNYPYNAITKKNLLYLADEALDVAKKLGKDCYFVQKSSSIIDTKDLYIDKALSKLENISSIIKISHDISNLVNVEKVIEKILNKAMKILNTDNGIISIENENGKLEVLSTVGFDSVPEYAKEIIDKTYKNAKEIIIDCKDFEKYDIKTGDSLISSIISIPIKFRKEVKGVFYSHLKRSVDISDIMVLNIILSQAAISIENAKFYKIGVEIQKLEAEKEYLEKLHKLKNDFINILSHDIKSPIGKIKMIASLLNDYASDFDEKQKKEFLSEIVSSSEFVLRLVENLLDVSKIEKGDLVLEKESVNFTEFVNDIIRENMFLARDKGIKIDYQYEETPEIKIDKIRITQVCNNFISNAIKFSPLNSEITISVNRDDKYVVFSVKDNGPGIPEKEQESLFKKEFYQTSVKSSRGEKGTGLGLFISKKIIDLHSGVIGVESEVGKGSRFYFKIPIN